MKNNNNLDDMSEIERDKEEREKGRRLHHHRPIEWTFLAIFLFSFLGGLVYLFFPANDPDMDELITKIILAIFFISGMLLIMTHKINNGLASAYCPYCYKKDFEKTTLQEKCMRAYTKYEKDNGREEKVPVRIEDWKARYRNECCGKEYEKTWQNKIYL